ncbi:MAG: REP-associated tyrosine transposase [Gaiellaceae bacterium]|jgi:REP element-mobilizing transposase RayT|nr:REP-associated tyrosine transposase [Gaiellaceae bacterium]
MSYTHRDEAPGYHHVVTRGNNKRDIYLDDRDRSFFCLTVDRVAKKYGWTVVAYCLMRNHYHLVIRVGEKGLADGMCELNTAYAINFNVEHGRINHLFGKRYWNRRLRSEGALFNAVRYVIRNPVLDGGSKPLESYAWTSYAATIGLAFAKMNLARDELLELFGSTPDAGVKAFREYCSTPVPRGHDRWQPP